MSELEKSINSINNIDYTPYCQIQEKGLSDPDFPTRRIYVVEPSTIVTHQTYLEDKAKKLNFFYGWRGVPLAVVELNTSIGLPKNFVWRVKNIPERSWGLLDGHHRYHAASACGINVPIQVFSISEIDIKVYLDKSIIPIEELVTTMIQSPGYEFKGRTWVNAKHQNHGNNYEPISSFQPNIYIPLEYLYK